MPDDDLDDLEGIELDDDYDLYVAREPECGLDIGTGLCAHAGSEDCDECPNNPDMRLMLRLAREKAGQLRLYEPKHSD